MRKLLACSLLAILGACGGGGSDDSAPEVKIIPFSNGAVPNTIGIGLAPSQGSVPEGWYPGCMDCARVLAVAQDRETAERVIASGTHLPVLDPVDFSKSSVIVFDRVVVGTSYQFRITSIEERDAGLTLRSSICAFRDVQIVNGALVGFVVVAKTNKPASFAKSETTAKPPISESTKPWGEC